jgi:2'-5' RNA ligase
MGRCFPGLLIAFADIVTSRMFGWWQCSRKRRRQGMKHYTARMHSDLFGPARTAESVTHNVFFALVPDAATRGSMAHTCEALRTRHDLQGRWLKPARYHMTLHFLGAYSELPQDRIAAACEAAARVQLPGFDLELDRAGHFPRGIGWLGCLQAAGPLRQLWEELHKELARARVGVQGHATFKPHVTVVRDAHPALPAEPVGPIAWPVREFVLIDSVLGVRNEYRTLGRWVLGDASR